jgi:hypothetical protein
VKYQFAMDSIAAVYRSTSAVRRAKNEPPGAGNVPRVGPFPVVLKRGEFRLELADSRRIVPVWTSTRTLGQRRGSRIAPRPPQNQHPFARFGRSERAA